MLTQVYQKRYVTVSLSQPEDTYECQECTQCDIILTFILFPPQSKQASIHILTLQLRTLKSIVVKVYAPGH